MKTALYTLKGNGLVPHTHNEFTQQEKTDLVLCFAAKELLLRPETVQLVQQNFSSASIAFCSTAGEIVNEEVFDGSMVVAALQFQHTRIQAASVNIQQFASSYEAGVQLVRQLPAEQLTYMLVLADGSRVNGSELVKGLNEAAGKEVLVTGGLAGDGSRFHSTLTGLNTMPGGGNVIAIGFYGNKFKVTHGSQGGWDSFGPEREVTRSEYNKLFEIDNKNALQLYKKYLGPEAAGLPGSALLFPLSVIIPGSTQPVVRTILSIDNETQSMIFAGDIPEHSKVRFMKANFDRLTEAAAGAATLTLGANKTKPSFSLLVSCVGRKLILGPRTEEETEAVSRTLGGNTLMAGFYSYGEISPFNEGGNCQLHNQTMTITSFYEHT